MSIPCHQCGKAIDVPTIRKLNEFAVAVPATKSSKSGSSTKWLGPVAAISLIVCLISFSYAGYLALERYALVEEMVANKADLSATEEDFLSQTRKAALRSQPADTWDYLNVMIEKGLQAPNPPDFFKVKRYLASRLPPLQISLTIGGITLAIFGIAAFVLQRGRKRI